MRRGAGMKPDACTAEWLGVLHVWEPRVGAAGDGACRWLPLHAETGHYATSWLHMLLA